MSRTRPIIALVALAVGLAIVVWTCVSCWHDKRACNRVGGVYVWAPYVGGMCIAAKEISLP